jgi:hypothetical protein
VVTIGVVFALVPDQAFGRSGGFGGRSLSIAPSFRGPVLRQSLSFRSPALKRSLLWHRRGFGYGAPLTGPFGSYYDNPYYDNADYMDPYYQPSYAYPAYPEGAVSEIAPGFMPPAVRHKGCESQTVSVPAEHGEKRSVDVNIVRCY